MFQSKNKKLLLVLFFALALFFTVQLVAATATSFTVRMGEEATRTLNLAVEDHISIELTTVSQQNTGVLDFWVAYPNGTIKVAYRNVGSVNYDFVCDMEGDYTLHFANVGSSDDILVSVNYDVGHTIFGIPQTLFLTIAIVVICVLAVAVFVLVGKRY